MRSARLNNAVWGQWIQGLYPGVIRHEIDYLRPALEGDGVIGTT